MLYIVNYAVGGNGCGVLFEQPDIELLNENEGEAVMFKGLKELNLCRNNKARIVIALELVLLILFFIGIWDGCEFPYKSRVMAT